MAESTELSSSQAPFSNGLIPADNARVYRPQFGAQGTDSHGELSPLHSPLLGRSWLVSFPPLNYMLKFSGSSYSSEIWNGGRKSDDNRALHTALTTQS